MKINIKQIIGLFILLILVHSIATISGLYKGKVWINVRQHFLGGVILGITWVWITLSDLFAGTLGGIAVAMIKKL